MHALVAAEGQQLPAAFTRRIRQQLLSWRDCWQLNQISGGFAQ
jgi:hypothetical protein